MCGHLRIGFAEAFDTFSTERFGERLVIFDDSVVNEGELAAIGEMGVGVEISGASVSGPACVAMPVCPSPKT